MSGSCDICGAYVPSEHHPDEAAMIALGRYSSGEERMAASLWQGLVEGMISIL